VVAAAVPFTRSADPVGLAIMANARTPIEFANTDTVSEHGPVAKEMNRAVALARLYLTGETETSRALADVAAALASLPSAWGKAMGAGSTRQPIEGGLAGPIVVAEGALERALDRLTAAASAGLLTTD
jgi:hypothetical protein